MTSCPYSTDCTGCVTFEDALLNIEHVSVSYGDKLVLRDLDIAIQKVKRRCHVQGQVIGILGPSGCGKTTLFRVMAGLEKPTSGQVLVNSKREPVKAGMVGVVSQGYTLFEHRTVLGNLMLAARKKFTTEDECSAKIAEYMRRFELTHELNAYPANLSGGQRQRIAIVQQLLSSNHFILMDEPYSGLDIVMLEKVNKLIVEISCLNELNTVVVVSHDITAVASVADHLWLLGHEEGKPGARIVENYNLVDLGLCWQENIQTRPDFVEFVRSVKERFVRL